MSDILKSVNESLASLIQAKKTGDMSTIIINLEQVNRNIREANEKIRPKD